MSEKFRLDEVFDAKKILVASATALGALISAGIATVTPMRDNFAQEVALVIEGGTCSNNQDQVSEENTSTSIPTTETEQERLFRRCGPGPIEYHGTFGVDEICFTGSCLVPCDEAVAAGMTRIYYDDFEETEN